MINYVSPRTAIVIKAIETTVCLAAAIALTIVAFAGSARFDAFLAFLLFLFYGLAIGSVFSLRRAITRLHTPTGESGSDEHRHGGRPLPIIEASRTADRITALRYAGVLISRDCVSQVERRIETRSIAWPDIRAVELRYGPASTNPLLQLIVGSAVVLLGLAPLVIVYGFVAGYAVSFPRSAAAWFAWVIPGIWIAKEAVKTRPHLRVYAKSKAWIFVFDADADLQTAREFIDSARRELGSTIVVDESVLNAIALRQATPN